MTPDFRATHPSPIPGRGMASRGEGWLRRTDVQLVERCAALPRGDLGGDFCEMVERYQPAVDAVCAKALGPGGDATEAAERAFAEFYGEMASLRESSLPLEEHLLACVLRHCRFVAERRAA